MISQRNEVINVACVMPTRGHYAQRTVQAAGAQCSHNVDLLGKLRPCQDSQISRKIILASFWFLLSFKSHVELGWTTFYPTDGAYLLLSSSAVL